LVTKLYPYILKIMLFTDLSDYNLLATVMFGEYTFVLNRRTQKVIIVMRGRRDGGMGGWGMDERDTAAKEGN
jgi:hypothetical protein